MKRYFLHVVVALAFARCATAQTNPAADLIIQNARVWTVDPSQPEAQAVAILGDRIVAVGSSQQVEVWRGAHTSVVDAGGRRLMPGFNDAHVHFVDGGSQLDNVELNDATSPQEFARAFASVPRRLPLAAGCSAAIGMKPSGAPQSCPPKS